MAVDSKTREEQRALLEEALDNLLDSDGFAAWLKVRQSFRTYSFNNQILIMLQDPDATQVAGYSAWKKLERQVRQGEHGIRIFAPCKYKEIDKETGEKRMVMRGFKLVSVFDIRQTDGEPLPELAGLEEVNGEGTVALWASLDSYAAELGYTVKHVTPAEDSRMRPGVGGFCDHSEKLIALNIDVGFFEAALLRVYVHELVQPPASTTRTSAGRTASYSLTPQPAWCCRRSGSTRSVLGCVPGRLGRWEPRQGQGVARSCLLRGEDGRERARRLIIR